MRRFVFGLLLSTACGSAVAQQQQQPPGLPTPRIQHVFPAGAKAGPARQIKQLGLTITLDTELTVTGTDLDEPANLYFSHPGITAEYLAPKAPPSDPKQKDKKDAPKAGSGPHKYRVTVDAAVPPGTYDVRFVGKWGISNPRAFVVSDWLEANETEPNNDVPEAQRIAIGTTINGVLASPTDVDYTVFSAKKGQRVLISCLTASIDSRASPLIELYESSGRKIAHNRGYRGNDALVDAHLPADGDYLVRLSQFAYQGGGPDYFYRLTISSGPWIDVVFPPVVEPGKPTTVTLFGRNLPNSQLADDFTVDGRPLEKLTVSITPPADCVGKLMLHDRIDPGTALQDGFEYVFRGPNGASNPVPVYLARDKLVVKKGLGGSPTAPEQVEAPCEVAGFIGRRGQSDWYSFDAKKGDQYLVELIGERGGTNADFFLSLRDGKDPKRDISGELDDDNDSLHPFGFFTRTTDPPAYKFSAPEAGKYLVVVGCRESSVLHGPRTAYRLRISPARPDFRAVAMPYSRFFQTGSSAWQGGTQAYDVFVHRIDGYSGAVSIKAAGLPKGVTAKPLSIGPAARWGVLVLDIAADAAPFTSAISLTATGTKPDGNSLVRDVRPASVTWGTSQPNANVPVIARLDQSLVLAVRAEKAPFSVIPEVAKAVRKVNNKDEKVPLPLAVKQGEKFQVPIKVNWAVAEKQNLTLTAEPMAQNPQSNPITVQVPTQPTKDKPEGTINVDVKSNAMPGTYSLVLKGVAQVPKPMTDGKKGGPNVPVEGFADPILVTVIPAAVAKVTPGALANNNLKVGTSGEMTVKVERQNDYTGEFKIRFVPPMGVKGVVAEEVAIPAGKDEAKLVIKAASDAKPGAVSNASVIVIALYDKKHTIEHEVKVSFTLIK
jgi:pre-peptidase